MLVRIAFERCFINMVLKCNNFMIILSYQFVGVYSVKKKRYANIISDVYIYVYAKFYYSCSTGNIIYLYDI